ncbi:MAG: tRNA 2-thiouridine(34) synthase MnmA [Bacteroidales bacterium]|nr:tRNA 2-thiouridine(34) synthase MnmA [Bacteroidales bacterium]
MNKKNVLLGMSGGTDSFVTALLLKDMGFNVKGVTFKFWDSKNTSDTSNNHIEQARKLAETIGISHQVVDLTDVFKNKIITPFIDEYISGRTPSPCAYCNPIIKWQTMIDLADKNDCYYAATGHYIRIKEIGDKYRILKGIDPAKDQSYFLWRLSSEVLKRALTPLGDYTKTEIKEIAKERGFIQMSVKKESMGICFLRGENYRDFINSNSNYNPQHGEILNISGEVIGTHNGLANYTVGQKQGVNCFDGQGRYVREMNAQTNTIVACNKNELFASSFSITDINIDLNSIDRETSITTIVRGFGLNPEGDTIIKMVDSNTMNISLENPAWAIAPGQPVAFYQNDLLIGGGIVKDVKY